MTKITYTEPVLAEIYRIEDDTNPKNKIYHFVRNKTKIQFGNDDKLLGTVIMTNPGSFKFKNNIQWKDFESGIGPDCIMDIGRPDPTMINIIRAVRDAYKEAKRPEPNGYVNIFNLSSARCSKGDKAEECHDRIRKAIKKNSLDSYLLEDPVVSDIKEFQSMCNDSPFVILGFLLNAFPDKAERIISWSTDLKSDKIIGSTFEKNKNWPYHPIMWNKIPKLEKDIVKKLSEII